MFPGHRNHLTMTLILTLCLLWPGAATVAQYTSSNVSLYSQIAPAQVSASSGNDCWGYVSATGREYALMGYNNKVTVVEITTPAAPVIVGSVSHTSSTWCGIKVYGNYAFASNEAGGGLDVINLQNVDSGSVSLVQRVTQNGLATAHTVAMNVDSGHLYLCGSNLNGGRLLAMSLADPANPTIAGAFTGTGSAYVHEAQVVNYTSGPYAGREIAFCCNGGVGFDIVDVTNKTGMFLVSHSTYPNLSYCHQGWLSEDRQYFYINDETDGINSTVVFDVSNLSSPVFLDTYTTGLPTADHNLYVRGNFVYEADYRGGLRIFCTAADPVNPIEVGWFDTYPADNNIGYNGAWSNFPFFPSGTVIVSDIERGLFVLNVAQALTAGALSFSYPNGRPELVNPAGGTRIRVQVTAACGADLAPGTGLLHYNAGAGYLTAPLVEISPGVYDAVFPSFVCGTTVNYYVSHGTAAGATKTDPADAPTTTNQVVAYSSQNLAFSDNMESDTGWVVGAAGDNAVGGVWTRVNPVGTAAQPEDDNPAGTGTFCWVTGQGIVGGALGANDVDGGTTTLTSPALDATGVDVAYVVYYRWYSNNTGSAPNSDSMPVLISNDNGANWVALETVTENAGAWVKKSFRVDQFVTPTNQVRLRFQARDLGSGSIVEAGVDDLQIVDFQCALPCPAADGDMNEDLATNGGDVQGFVSALGGTPLQGDVCHGDFSGNSALGLEDVDGFVRTLLMN